MPTLFKRFNWHEYVLEFIDWEIFFLSKNLIFAKMDMNFIPCTVKKWTKEKYTKRSGFIILRWTFLNIPQPFNFLESK
jgi:hypothetical protein